MLGSVPDRQLAVDGRCSMNISFKKILFFFLGKVQRAWAAFGV